MYECMSVVASFITRQLRSAKWNCLFVLETWALLCARDHIVTVCECVLCDKMNFDSNLIFSL